MKVQDFMRHRLLPHINDLLTIVFALILVFLIIGILIGLFQHKLPPPEIYALSALLLVLGSLRIASVLVHQRERAISSRAHSEHS